VNGSVPVDIVRRDRDRYSVSFIPLVEGACVFVFLIRVRTIRPRPNSTRFSEDTIRYDTIEEFNMDSKAEYLSLSSTRSQKKKLKRTTPVPL